MRLLAKIATSVSLMMILASCATTTQRATNLPSLLFVKIPSAGDSFVMGDGSTGVNATQSFSYSFMISKYEITNAQFSEFVRSGGYDNKKFWTANGWTAKGSEAWTAPQGWPDSFKDPNHPAGAISWYEAVAFCNWLSANEGLPAAYDSSGRASLASAGYRLPTEAEWEYAAAKGGSGNRERVYAYGDNWDINKEAADLPGPIDVGSRSAAGGDTPQGLVDIGGNIREWCTDNHLDDGSVADGRDRYIFTSDSPEARMCMRGGPYHRSTEQFFRVANREPVAPTGRGGDYGFRIVHR